MTIEKNRTANEAAGGKVVPSASDRVAPGDSVARIRALNDVFRRSFRGGRVMMTRGVSALGRERLVRLVARVQRFDDFSADNDPYSEHDFGAFDDAGDRFFWKIDYYDQTLSAGSEDPSDPSRTVRVLTLMLADEY